MLKATAVVGQSEIYDKIKALYFSAFAENERAPLDLLFKDKSEQSKILAFFDGETFCGFMCFLKYLDIMHITYFAIDENLRGRGYGSMALALVKNLIPECRIIADIELIRKNSVNKDERVKRKAFYLNNGYQQTKIKYRWKGESYEILSCGGEVSVKEFIKFWNNIEKINRDFAKF